MSDLVERVAHAICQKDGDCECTPGAPECALMDGLFAKFARAAIAEVFDALAEGSEEANDAGQDGLCADAVPMCGCSFQSGLQAFLTQARAEAGVD